jgi:hypothetical protein
MLDYENKKVVGTTLGPRDADPGHGHGHGPGSGSTETCGPFVGFVSCNSVREEQIRDTWDDIVTILNVVPDFTKTGVLEVRSFVDNIAKRNDHVTFIKGINKISISSVGGTSMGLFLLPRARIYNRG